MADKKSSKKAEEPTVKTVEVNSTKEDQARPISTMGARADRPQEYDHSEDGSTSAVGMTGQKKAHP